MATQGSSREMSTITTRPRGGGIHKANTGLDPAPDREHGRSWRWPDLPRRRQRVLLYPAPSPREVRPPPGNVRAHDRGRVQPRVRLVDVSARGRVVMVDISRELPCVAMEVDHHSPGREAEASTRRTRGLDPALIVSTDVPGGGRTSRGDGAGKAAPVAPRREGPNRPGTRRRGQP